MAVTGEQTSSGGGTGRAGGVGTPGVSGGFGGNRSDNFGGNPRDVDQDQDAGDRNGVRRSGIGGGRDRDRRRIFTAAELAAEAARRDLLRLLAGQGQGATILALDGGAAGGPSIFGAGDSAKSRGGDRRSEGFRDRQRGSQPDRVFGKDSVLGVFGHFGPGVAG